MKKLVAILLFATLCLGLFACGETPEESTTMKETLQTTEAVGTTEATETEVKDTDKSEESEKGDGTVVTDGESEEITLAETTASESTEGETVTESEPEQSSISAETVTTVATEGAKETLATEKAETDESDETEETEEIETEDPRLSAEYAPVVYFDAKAIYELTKDGIYEDVAQLFSGYDEVTYHKEKGQRAYTTIKTWNDMQTAAEAYISLCTSPMEVAPIFAVKYRTTTPGISMEIYTDSVNPAVTSGNIVRIPVESDGEWHVEYVSLTSIKQFNGSTINYFRFDIMNATRLPVDAYIEFEYFGFFNSEDEVEMFETGKYVPVIYVDDNAPYKDATNDIVHASSIDMINGAGGSTATKFDYRGGNSLKGVDKFNHNGTTLSGGKLVFSGWTVVEGGIEKYVWSIDGLNWYDATFNNMSGLGDVGAAHIAATESYTGATIIDTVNSVKDGGYQGNIGVNNPEERARGLACELLKVASVGDKVNVRFAVVPKSDPTKLCLIAYVKNVEVVAEFEYEEETEVVETFAPDMIEPEDCAEHNVSFYWYPVAGQAMEEKLCLLCGEVVESRSVAFYSSFDIIEDKNGGKNTGLYGANKAFDKDGAYIVLRDGYDFVLQGWFATNGGVADYMYSVDGGATWIVAGNSSNLSDKFTGAHVAAIESAKLDIAKYDVKGMYRVNLPLKQFAIDKETTLDVLFGAKLANNESVIITIANIKNVKIPAAPAGGEPTPEPTVKFDKSTDKIYVGATLFDNPKENVSGQFFTLDASASDLSAGKSVKWLGWAAIEGGFAGWAYSLDDGKTWIAFTAGYSDTTRTDVIGHLTNNLGYTNATKNGNLNLEVDLSAYEGQTVSVIFGGYAVSDPETVIPMVKIANISIPKVCDHEGEKWMPVAGQLKEALSCDECGTTITRDVKFLNNIDRVEGTNNGSSATIDPPDGVDLVSRPTATIESREGKDIVVQGWLAVNGGVHKYVYSIDGGKTWLECGNQPNYKGEAFVASQPHIDAINGANLGFSALDADVNGRYRVACDLSSKSGETVTVTFGVILENNRDASPLQILVVTVKVTGQPSGTTPDPEPESEIKFLKAINDLYIGDAKVHNPAGGYGGELFVYDAKDVAMTGFTVKWAGWAGINDGINKWVYSTDGGNTWKEITAGVANTTDSGILNALSGAGFTNATAKGTFGGGLIADLSDLTVAKAEVIFAAVPNCDTTKILPMVKIINIKLPNDCTHPGAESWTAVAGQLKESGTCTRCGETIERDITFVVCVDKVTYEGGARGWAATTVCTTPYVVNNVASMPVMAGKGITVQGWVGINGGVSKYMWSIDGETWYEAGEGYYSNTGIPGAVNGYGTGISNVSTNCQYNLNLTGLCNLAAGRYTVYFGAVPANNTSVVVPIVQIENVVVS